MLFENMNESDREMSHKQYIELLTNLMNIKFRIVQRKNADGTVEYKPEAYNGKEWVGVHRKTVYDSVHRGTYHSYSLGNAYYKWLPLEKDCFDFIEDYKKEKQWQIDITNKCYEDTKPYCIEQDKIKEQKAIEREKNKPTYAFKNLDGNTTKYSAQTPTVDNSGCVLVILLLIISTVISLI